MLIVNLVGNLQMMTCQFGHQAEGVLIVKAPVDFTLQLGLWNRSYPVVVSMPKGFDLGFRTYMTFLKHFLSLMVLEIEHPLMPDIKYLSGFQMCFHRSIAFLRSLGHGFFTKNMDASYLPILRLCPASQARAGCPWSKYFFILYYT
jgi:hypothetical protein